MKIIKKHAWGIGFTLTGILLCVGAIFLENLLAVPGFILLIGGMLLWNPGGVMDNLYPLLK